MALKPHEDILEREALRTGQTKTAIMKAALAAYEHGLDENGKNHWILQSARLK
ncbi:CopG family transcriptional regulator [Escherichia coli]|nr:CopG family transcriptional regulator [Escherichia coli]EFH0865547.1 CopG family transcriptional regulator [Escherichia coli]EGP3571383.1 CopG family transcriptional regulator [Escherichia coli]